MILLSDYFQVTTDYLLKNDEVIEKHKNKSNSEYWSRNNVAVIISSALIVIGLIVGWARCSTDGAKLQYLPFHFFAPGIIIQVIGIVLFEIYNSKLDDKTRTIKKYWFYGVNIWFLDILPIMFIIGRFFDYVVGSYSRMPDLCMLAFYIAISSIISLLCFLRIKSRK